MKVGRNALQIKLDELLVKQQEVSAQLARTLTEIKLHEEEYECSALSAVTDIKSLISLKVSRFPNLAADVILLSKLHSKYITDTEKVERRLFLVVMQAKLQNPGTFFAPGQL